MPPPNKSTILPASRVTDDTAQKVADICRLYHVNKAQALALLINAGHAPLIRSARRLFAQEQIRDAAQAAREFLEGAK